MLIRTVSQALVHLREGRDNLILLDIWDGIIKDNPSIQLETGISNGGVGVGADMGKNSIPGLATE